MIRYLVASLLIALFSSPALAYVNPGFMVTEGVYSYTSDHAADVKRELGGDYVVADWYDYKEFYNANYSASNPMESHFGSESKNVFVNRSGSSFWNGRRYFATVTPPGALPHASYLSHDNAGNHNLDLGSWYSSMPILAYSESIANAKRDYKTYGIFIGVNSYNEDGSIELSGADDAKNMSDKFNNLHNNTDFTLFVGDDLDNNVNIDKYEIMRQLDRIKKEALPGDKLIVYFSGHGVSENNGEETTITSGDENLVLASDYETNASGTSTISDDELARWLNGMDYIEKTVILDSCKSGGFWGNGNSEDVGDLEKLQNIALLAASSELFDTFADPNTGMGFFTEALLEGFYTESGYMLFDSNHDNVVSTQEMIDWVNGFTLSDFLGWHLDNIVPKDGNYDGPSGLWAEDFEMISFHSDDYVGLNFVASAVPEPSTFLLLGAGLIGMIAVGRKRSRNV